MKLVRLTTTLFLLFFIVSLLSFAQNNDREGTITFLKGTCLLKRDGEEYKKALLNQSISSGSTIKTLEESEAEITLEDGNLLVLTEDSEITLHN